MFADYNYLFAVAHCFFFIGLPIGCSFLFCQIVKQAFAGKTVPPSWLPYVKFSEYYLEKAFYGRCEDVCVIATVVCAVFFLHGRISNGPCTHTHDTWWYSQTCNAVAADSSIPQDQVLLIYIWPLFAVIYFRGFSLEMLILSYIIGIAGVAIAVYRVNGINEIYSVLYGIVVAIIAVEIERWQRISYLLHEKVTEKQLTELERVHQSEIAEIARDASNKKKLQELEQVQLKSLMANVAHDLKTPLHSIMADLNTLKTRLNKQLLIRRNSSSSSSSSPFPAPSLSSSKHEGEEEDSAENLVESIDSACKFMAMAIHRSQDYMKASSNLALLPSLGSFDISEAVQVAFTCVNSLDSGRTIKVHPLPTGLCSYVISDRHWLVENLMCLLSNAVKYSERGTTVDIRVKLLEYDELAPLSVGVGSKKGTPGEKEAIQRSMLAFYVEDNGNGMANDTQEHLFQPFKQAQRLAGGTGLGLYALAKRLEALNGLYGVRNRLDGRQGSEFWFSFPYRPDATTAYEMLRGSSINDRRDSQALMREASMMRDASERHSERRKSSQNSLALMAPIGVPAPRASTTSHITPTTKRPVVTPMRVLLTDDTVSVLKITGRMLRRAGHTVEVAENGSQSLNLLKQRYDEVDGFQLLLTDLQMPVMDGLESAKRFREFEEQRAAEDLSAGRAVKKKLLIVGMSANDDAEIRDEAMSAGMDAWLPKPFGGHDFDRCVKLLQLSSNGQEAGREAGPGQEAGQEAGQEGSETLDQSAK